MNDEYDFCGLKRGECHYQINGDKKIATLEKALELACEALSEGYGIKSGLFKGKICYECDKEDSKVMCLCSHLTPSYFLQKARE